MRVFWIAFGAMLALAGCQTTMPTASGKPEILVAAVAQDAKAAIVGTYVNLGASLLKDTDFQVVLQEAGMSPAAKALFGPGMDYRMTFTFLAQGDKTRIVGEGALITRSGTAFEQSLPTNANAPGERMQFVLQQIADGFSASQAVDVIATNAAQAARNKYPDYFGQPARPNGQ